MTRPPSPLLDLVEKYRLALLKRDAAALDRLTRTYVELYGRLTPKIELLIKDIEAMLTAGEYSRAKVIKLRSWLALQEQIANELNDYAAFVRSEIPVLTRAALQAADSDAVTMLRLLAGDAAEITTLKFARLPQEAIIQMLGFLDPAGPLYDRLRGLAPYTADKIASTLLEGIGLGYNPRKVAGLITGNAERSLGLSLTDSLRMARTVQLYSYREASRANYLANSDVVSGWIWWAELDDSTCLSCVAQHGTRHDLDEELDDHYNGRCTMIPEVFGANPLEGAQTGQDWFNGLSDAEQERMMGKERYAAFQDGKFDFSALSVERKDETYGRMKFEASLKDLIGE